MHFLSVCFQTGCQTFLILAGNIDDLFQMFLQVFQPLILIHGLHMRPSAMQKFLDIARLLQLLDL